MWAWASRARKHFVINTGWQKVVKEPRGLGFGFARVCGCNVRTRHCGARLQIGKILAMHVRSKSKVNENHDSERRLASCFGGFHSTSPQIQCERELRARGNIFWPHCARRVTETEKARQPAAFGLIGIHWKGGVTESTRMSDVICATSYAVAIPRVHDIEHERCVKTDRRMQATGR